MRRLARCRCRQMRPSARGLPGLAPAGDSLSFASPKESKPRKGDPTVCVPTLRYGQPALLAASGVGLNSLRSNNVRPDPLSAALLGAYRGGSPKGKVQQPECKFKQGRAMARPCGLRFLPAGFCIHGPRRYEETRSAGAAGSGLALFERSEFSQTPAAPSIAVCPRSGPTNPARLFFASFLLAKQKKGRRPPGRDPACNKHNQDLINQPPVALLRPNPQSQIIPPHDELNTTRHVAPRPSP